MLEQTVRMYHCHKLKKNVYILEDYEILNGVRTLVRCSCPNYMGTAADGRKCNGLNDYLLRCGFSEWTERK